MCAAKHLCWAVTTQIYEYSFLVLAWLNLAQGQKVYSKVSLFSNIYVNKNVTVAYTETYFNNIISFKFDI